MNWTITKYISFDQIDSTNTWAKQNVFQWAPQGMTLITSGHQTAGRGRLKRRWESPPDVNIYATFCFWLELERMDFIHIPQLLALAAAHTLEYYTFEPKIKWPNDILLSKKKVAGVLCETIFKEQQRGIICGIGLNINMTLEALSQINRPATSLFVESGHLFNRAAILHYLISCFEMLLNTFIQEGFSPFFPLFEKRLNLKKGESIRFHDHQKWIEGEFDMLQRDGSVVLRLSDGTLRTYYAGEFIDD